MLRCSTRCAVLQRRSRRPVVGPASHDPHAACCRSSSLGGGLMQSGASTDIPAWPPAADSNRCRCSGVATVDHPCPFPVALNRTSTHHPPAAAGCCRCSLRLIQPVRRVYCPEGACPDPRAPTAPRPLIRYDCGINSNAYVTLQPLECVLRAATESVTAQQSYRSCLVTIASACRGCVRLCGMHARSTHK